MEYPMTLTIDLINSGALNLLQDMERLNLIHVNSLPAKDEAASTPVKAQKPNICEFLRQAPLDGVVIERDTNTVLRGTGVSI